MFKNLHLDAPSIGKFEKKYVNEALDSGYVSTIGPFVPKFEEKFASYIGMEKAVSTQSGTSALHMALYELGIGKGDQVIVPALTFVATVNPIVYVGAEPVFVDVDIRTWNIDPVEIEKNITEKTKAIIPVHLYGNPCNMNDIMNLAKKHGLYVVEDATESLGALYDNKHTGTLGDLGCFSFNGNKTITTGGGGMVVSHDAGKMNHIKFLVNQARDESKEVYYHTEIGFNYRMTNIEAALGYAQLERLEEFLTRKRAMESIYKTEFSEIEEILFQQEYGAGTSSCWLACAVFNFDKINVTELQNKLYERGIPARRVFMPVVDFPPFKDYNCGKSENSYLVHEKGLCLPSSTLNSLDDIYNVCRVIKETLGLWKK